MQIECLLPASKVSFAKFGERYCLMQNNYARGKSFYGSKYDGAPSQNYITPISQKHRPIFLVFRFLGFVP